MIKDISLIRSELEGFIEVELPYEFEKGSQIKYITKKNEEESFYKGGKFNYFGNDCIFIETNSRKWSVPTCKRNKDGSIAYQSRFFIKSEEEAKCDKVNHELNQIIEYQQSIIEKLSEKNKKLEIINVSLTQDKRDYEELLQQNRFNFKELSIESRKKDNIITKYESVIQKLTNSHSVFTG